jgi:hypothetical protein
LSLSNRLIVIDHLSPDLTDTGAVSERPPQSAIVPKATFRVPDAAPKLKKVRVLMDLETASLTHVMLLQHGLSAGMQILQNFNVVSADSPAHQHIPDAVSRSG